MTLTILMADTPFFDSNLSTTWLLTIGPVDEPARKFHQLPMTFSLSFSFFFFLYVTKEEFLSGGIFVSDLKRGLLFESSSCGYSAKSLLLILKPMPQLRKCSLLSLTL
ncbi:unnamed protein product [Fusarium venenatum]|uniref:Uncharacterized protein n=1 Tax=Fusarium venenatum TaxID=56646 RepID=A0A2L2TD52_9HYPO|nr:LOW QUALITY PROTEIN: uncharacterized protein FVRRES_05352 [Fusarium venenatum]CEI60916.1 unnamed protein product [Fusarium venenatum]